MLRRPVDDPRVRTAVLGTERRLRRRRRPTTSSPAGAACGLDDFTGRTVAVDALTGTTTEELWSAGGGPAATRAVRGVEDWLTVIAAGQAVGMSSEATAAQHRRPGVVYRPVRDAPPVPVWLAWWADSPPSHLGCAAAPGPRGVRPTRGTCPAGPAVRRPNLGAVSGERAAASAGVGFRSERGPVLIGIMLSTALVAIDATVIATAVPSVVAELGGFAEFPWLFSVYLLAQAVTVPVYGKLADVFGRKPVMLVGIGLFLVGSILCGLAWSMGALIAFRAVQGLGAGAVQPMSMTIVGDLYSLEERAKVQGYIASVWGISSVVGPTLGGVFSEYVSWRWIFFVNIPLCLIAAATIGLRFHERVERRRPRIDYAGAGVLTVALTLLILGLLEGGQAWAWRSPQSVAVLGGGAVLLGGVRPDRAPGGRSRRPAAAAAQPPARRDEPRRGVRRRRPAGADLLRADVRAGRAGHRPAGRRLRAGRPHPRLAALGVPVRPGLPADRLPVDLARRRRRRRPGLRRCCSCSTSPRACSRSARRRS